MLNLTQSIRDQDRKVARLLNTLSHIEQERDRLRDKPPVFDVDSNTQMRSDVPDSWEEIDSDLELERPDSSNMPPLCDGEESDDERGEPLRQRVCDKQWCHAERRCVCYAWSVESQYLTAEWSLARH